MLQILLPPETEEALRERANVRGEDVEIYAARLLQDAMMAPDVEELLRPFRQQVNNIGTTDEELERLCEELRQDAWDQRQILKAKSA